MPYNWTKPFEIRDLRNGDWFWVERYVWKDERLTASDKVLYGSLAYFANGKDQSAFPSLSTLADESKLSRSQIKISVRKLKETGYIKVVYSAGKVNKYQLIKNKPNNVKAVISQNLTGSDSDQVRILPTTGSPTDLPLGQNTATNNNNINNNNLTRINRESTHINKYVSLTDIKQEDLIEIAEKYNVPLAFVKSKLDDLTIWVESKPNNSKLKGRNYRMTLMRFVKEDAFKIRKEEDGRSKITVVSPDPNWENS